MGAIGGWKVRDGEGTFVEEAGEGVIDYIASACGSHAIRGWKRVSKLNILPGGSTLKVVGSGGGGGGEEEEESQR